VFEIDSSSSSSSSLKARLIYTPCWVNLVHASEEYEDLCQSCKLEIVYVIKCKIRRGVMVLIEEDDGSRTTITTLGRTIVMVQRHLFILYIYMYVSM